jgi:hypothetical protein
MAACWARTSPSKEACALASASISRSRRWSSFSAIPPLTITAPEIREAFAIIDRGLEITDAAFEG